MKKIIAIFALAAMVFIGCSCGKTADEELLVSEAVPTVEGKELIATVETQEEAEAIAEQYGIEFVSFSYHVATFHTEEDPQEVIDRGVENGWPTLSLNTVSSID